MRNVKSMSENYNHAKPIYRVTFDAISAIYLSDDASLIALYISCIFSLAKKLASKIYFDYIQMFIRKCIFIDCIYKTIRL